MKTHILVMLFAAFSIFSSCIPEGDVDVNEIYYIYITGDTGRTVQISYLEQGLVKNTGQESLPDGTIPEYVGGDNVITAETATLPFFKKVHYVWNNRNRQDRFLEVASTKDATTKAVIFHSDVVLADTFCKVAYVFNSAYGVPDECAYCKNLSIDSVLSYLKYAEYPCYREFSQGDKQQRLSLTTILKWEQKTGLYFGNAKR
ncbi:MAG: hypothetical protein LBO71_10950 [Prevotellaceae bacterium]|jgi:hypothetical protein|nr:hypothetical protein [Prevotellaceae bacterium]